MTESFSASAKEVLARKSAAAFGFSDADEKAAPDCCRLSFFASLILFGAKPDEDTLVFSSKSEKIRDLFASMAAAFYSLSPAVTPRGVSVRADDALMRVLRAAGVQQSEAGLFSLPIPVCGDCLRYIFRAAFLCRGTVSAPDKHSQLCLFLSEYADLLLPLAADAGLAFRRSVRRQKPYLYLKSALDIEDFFTFIGAEHIALSLIDRDVEKHTRAVVNRRVNCDLATSDRISLFATRLKNAACTLDRAGILESLPENLLSLARVCRDYPDISALSEFGELLHPPLSRSGLYHRARAIIDLADKTEV